MKNYSLFAIAFVAIVFFSQSRAFQTVEPISQQRRRKPVTAMLQPHKIMTRTNFHVKQQQPWMASSSSSDGLDGDEDSRNPGFFSLFMIGLPFLSAVFPELLQLAKSLTPNSSEQLAVVTALFVGNRAYLYALSATIVGLTALRGATDSPLLGQRVIDLTEELLYRPSLEELPPQPTNELKTERGRLRQEQEKKPAMIQTMAQSGLGESLDDVSTETQALILPVLVSALLATSVFLLPIWNGPGRGDSIDEAIAFQSFLSEWLPRISQIWNAALLTLFTRSEIRRLSSELLKPEPSSTASNDDSSMEPAIIFEWVVALVITGIAFLTPLWPAQNFVNMALAVLVARAIQLNKFPAIIVALMLLTLYDASSVFFIPAANAILDTAGAAATTTTTITAADVSSSAMGSVAVQKLSSGIFQPGLLVTKIGDRLGGSLGLGDAVFPSLLTTFVRRFDVRNNIRTEGETKRPSLFTVSMVGYILGCVSCEFTPLLSTSGLPALVFIIPFMLGSVITASYFSGELQDLWNFDPKGELQEG